MDVSRVVSGDSVPPDAGTVANVPAEQAEQDAVIRRPHRAKCLWNVTHGEWRPACHIDALKFSSGIEGDVSAVE